MLSLNETSSIVKGAALFDDPRTIAANPIAFIIDQTFAGLRPSFAAGSSLYNLQFTSSSASLISSSLCILIVMSCSLSRNQILIFFTLDIVFQSITLTNIDSTNEEILFSIETTNTEKIVGYSSDIFDGFSF